MLCNAVSDKGCSVDITFHFVLYIRRCNHACMKAVNIIKTKSRLFVYSCVYIVQLGKITTVLAL